MKVPDLFVGKQLYVGIAVPPAICFGIGPTKIRGSAYLEGPVLIGSPISYTTAPNVTEANLMVARCGNMEALPPPPSIFKVSTRGFSPTPIDVMLGDPSGHVGISVNSLVINILNDTTISIISPITSGIGFLKWTGTKVLTGSVIEVGSEARVGKEVVSSLTTNNGPKKINGPLSVTGLVKASAFVGNISACKGKKNFDIKHPSKEGHRLRYVCLEGPSADVFLRGKLVNDNTIKLPEYWKNLVDPETISINLTPIDVYQELYVEKIEWGQNIIVRNNLSGPIRCHYVIYGERKDVEKNIPEYQGLTPADYPGDNSQCNINGL